MWAKIIIQNRKIYSNFGNIHFQLINLKKTLKTQTNDTDEAMTTDSREALSGIETRKKSGKSKIAKGKTWNFRQYLS